MEQTGITSEKIATRIMRRLEYRNETNKRIKRQTDQEILCERRGHHLQLSERILEIGEYYRNWEIVQ